MKNSILSYKKVNIYRDGILILKEIDFEVFEEQFIFITGQIGSGKSTLLKSIYAEIPIKFGEGKVFDFNLKNIPKNQIPFLRRRLGIVFQDFQLLTDRNIYNNLKFVLEATGWIDENLIDNRIKEVLTMVDILSKKDKMPNQLSGGEQQTVMIARALLNNPKLIIADEPTGNLDAESSEKIFNLLYKISESGSTVIFATHNTNLLQKQNTSIFKIENQKITSIR